jgi:hypothetical protein
MASFATCRFATYWRSAQDHAKRGNIAKAFTFTCANTQGGLAVRPTDWTFDPLPMS